MAGTLWCAKIPYETAAAAADAMHVALRRRGHSKSRGDGLKVSAYKCVACGMYHWGHYGATATPKRKNRRAQKPK